MPNTVGDTIVVCRPEQLREAAIVLSCCRSDAFTPLVVIDRPPIAEGEYRQRYAAYVDARNRRDVLSASHAGDLSKLAAAKAAAEETDQKAEALTAYRSWWHHQRAVADLLTRLAVRRAVLLFVPEPNEVQLINPLPTSRISEERQPTLPTELELTFLLPESGGEGADGGTCVRYKTLGDLPAVAWRAIRRDGAVPSDVVAVAMNDVNAYFPALARAMSTGVPLQPVDQQSAASTIDAIDATPPGSEALLIEMASDAARLLGVQYAHHRGTKLVCYPEPATGEIDAALAALRATDGGSKAATAISSFFRRTWEYAFGDTMLGDGIRKLEVAVSRAVPSEVVSAVGDLDLTVLTSGVPYNFLKRGEIDWTSKAIGHIAGDISLLLLHELCPSAQVPTVTFSLLFDPGHFQTPETSYVLAALQQRASYPLVLREFAASSVALTQLAQHLPLDVLYFNTHGSDQAIVLADGALPAFKIVQRLSLPSRPIVFNNSCLSWVGVGEEFVRVGARAYIGTLWSVDAALAADFARAVMERITLAGLPMSRALRGTGVEGSTARAYIHVGTCGARLDATVLEDRETLRMHIVSAVESLFGQASIVLQLTRGHPPQLPVGPAIVRTLCAEAERLSTEYNRLFPTVHPARIRLNVARLNVLSYMVELKPDDVRAEIPLIAETEHLLATLPISADERRGQLAWVLRFGGSIHLKLGESSRAIELLTRSIELFSQVGEPSPDASLELCDALRLEGRDAEALVLAKAADAVYAEQLPQPRKRLLSLGRVGQLSRKLNELQDALRYAREGVRLAIAFDAIGEEATFIGDEANVLLHLQRFDEAIVAGQRCLELRRQIFDFRGETIAFGVLGQAYFGKKDYMSAIDYAQRGLKQAQELGMTQSARIFSNDLARVSQQFNQRFGFT